MALRWDFNEKVGEVTFKKETGDGIKDFVVDLYQGNAYLIMIYEWDEDGDRMYNLQGFFCDKEHMKNCLGLNKRRGYTENIYNKPYDKLTKIRLNKAKYSYTKEVIDAFVQAFDEIEIEIYSEE